MKTKPLDICYQKHYYPAIGKIYKDYNIRGGDTQRFEEMWLDRVRSYPGVDAAQPRQQSNIQWWNKSQGSRQHGKKKKKKSISPMKSYRGRATIPREKQWLPRSKWACICTVEVKCKRDLLRLLPLHSCTKPPTTSEGLDLLFFLEVLHIFIYMKFSVACS